MHSSLIFASSIDDDGGPAFEQDAVAGTDVEIVQDMIAVTGKMPCFDQQISWHIIEPADMQSYATHADQKTKLRTLVLLRAQSAMHCHCLGRIFDTADGAQLIARAQGIVPRTMAEGDAAYTMSIPGPDPIQQAHIAMMRNARSNPVAV